MTKSDAEAAIRVLQEQEKMTASVKSMQAHHERVHKNDELALDRAAPLIRDSRSNQVVKVDGVVRVGQGQITGVFRRQVEVIVGYETVITTRKLVGVQRKRAKQKGRPIEVEEEIQRPISGIVADNLRDIDEETMLRRAVRHEEYWLCDSGEPNIFLFVTAVPEGFEGYVYRSGKRLATPAGYLVAVVNASHKGNPFFRTVFPADYGAVKNYTFLA